ncbi:MAG: YdeI/OmpD-associated family protein [Bacteroidales bacterium]|jgi:uncharacterized protein YdeI (YjbR/CyaY-like superfamily)|nr:YdeI/OmpD-associated family protein [Bacteroidales bacterium]
MRELEQVFFENRESLRSWLGKNHKESPGIWMIYYKKHTGTTCIEYREALEEALCFGWIDSTLRRIDDERYVRKFTPRTNTSNWSDVNKKLVVELIKKGKMTEAGLQKIDVWLKTGKVDWKLKSGQESKDKELQVPDYFLKALAENEPALANFKKLARSYKRQYILWITFAKREETIQKRMKEAVELLKENKLPGLR